MTNALLLKQLVVCYCLYACCSCCCDPYFENDPWFEQLQAQVSIGKFPKDIACRIRPPLIQDEEARKPKGGLPRAKKKKIDLVVGLAFWESVDHIVDGVKNALHFTATQTTGVVFHINKHMGTKESNKQNPTIERELINTIAGRMNKFRQHSLFSDDKSLRLLLNPYRIEVEWMTGSILLCHLANYRASLAIGWQPAYYMLVASNSRFIACGIESHIASYKLSFGYREVCDRHEKYVLKNVKNSQAHTIAEPYGLLAEGQRFKGRCCCHICSDDHNPISNRTSEEIFKSVQDLLYITLNFSSTYSHSQMKPRTSVSKSFQYWQYNNNFSLVKGRWFSNAENDLYRGIVQQRHEGSYFPSPVLTSLGNKLAYATRDNMKNSQVVASLHGVQKLQPLNSTRLGYGLAVLSEVSLPTEEFLLSTWMLQHYPHLIPVDRESRDVPTYIISGRSINASSDHITYAVMSGYLLVKRVLGSPVRNIPNQCASKGSEVGGSFLKPHHRFRIFHDVNSNNSIPGKMNTTVKVQSLRRPSGRTRSNTRRNAHWCSANAKLYHSIRVQSRNQEGDIYSHINGNRAVRLPNSIEQVNEIIFLVLAGFVCMAILVVFSLYVITLLLHMCSCRRQRRFDQGNVARGG